MCEIPGCEEFNCKHKKVKELKIQVFKKLEEAEKYRYKNPQKEIFTSLNNTIKSSSIRFKQD